MDMYGFKRPEEIIGKSIIDFQMGDNGYFHRHRKRTFVESGYQIKNYISQEIDLQGIIKYFNNSIIGVIDNGFLIRVWGTQSDITEQKIAEQALNESEAFYRAIINASPDAIAMTNLEGILLKVSPRALKMFNCKNENEILGKIG